MGLGLGIGLDSVVGSAATKGQVGMYPSLGLGERERAAADALRACSSTEGHSSNPPESGSPDSVGMRACSEFPERSAHSVMPTGNALASLAAAHEPLRASLLASPRLPR